MERSVLEHVSVVDVVAELEAQFDRGQPAVGIALIVGSQPSPAATMSGVLPSIDLMFRIPPAATSIFIAARSFDAAARQNGVVPTVPIQAPS